MQDTVNLFILLYINFHKSARLYSFISSVLKLEIFNDYSTTPSILLEHRETVLTILSDGTLGPKSLEYTRETTKWYVWKHLRKVEYIQPMTLLITQMPG